MRLRDVSWAAEVLGTSRARIYQLARQGTVPVVRIGRRVLFEETQLEDFVARGGAGLHSCARHAGHVRLVEGVQAPDPPPRR